MTMAVEMKSDSECYIDDDFDLERLLLTFNQIPGVLIIDFMYFIYASHETREANERTRV